MVNENGLTPKQQKFVDEYIMTGNGTRSAMKAYDTEDKNTAAAIASESLRKPNVLAYLSSKAQTAAEVIHDLMLSAENETVRLNASKDVLDRAGYKPVDKKDITTDGESLNKELNDSDIDNIIKRYVDKSRESGSFKADF